MAIVVWAELLNINGGHGVEPSWLQVLGIKITASAL